MIKKRTALTLSMRQSLWMMKSERISIREIGRRLGICPSVVSRELKRNSLPVHISCHLTPLERAREAHDKAKRRCREKRRGKRKAKPLMSVFKHIGEKLHDGWSPETIANTFSNHFPTKTISTSTIYRMIKQDAPELIKHLPEHGEKRRARVVNRRGRFSEAAQAKRHMSERPATADSRSEVGHLEGDCVLSKRGSHAAVLSLCDRKLRMRWFFKLPNLKAETIRKQLIIFFSALPQGFLKTLTLDRGSEFAEWDMLEKIFKELRVYFCTAYSPHEKGSVERSNRELRRFFPKGTDFSQVSDETLNAKVLLINQRPMKCLGWKSPAELYSAEMAEQHYQQAA